MSRELNQGHGVIGLNPQQQKFKEGYINPSSPTFGNAYKSALAADYEEYYAKNITAQGNAWFCDIMRHFEMSDSAEKGLKEMVEIQIQNDEGKIDPAIGRLKLDAIKFVLPAIKADVWNPVKRLDHTTDGKPFFLSNDLMNKYGVDSSAKSDRTE